MTTTKKNETQIVEFEEASFSKCVSEYTYSELMANDVLVDVTSWVLASWQVRTIYAPLPSIPPKRARNLSPPGCSPLPLRRSTPTRSTILCQGNAANLYNSQLAASTRAAAQFKDVLSTMAAPRSIRRYTFSGQLPPIPRKPFTSAGVHIAPSEAWERGMR